MTDIASDLADQIMALINSKPRSPTKDELVAVIAEPIGSLEALVRLSNDAALSSSFPAFLVTNEMLEQFPEKEIKPGGWVAVSSEMMHHDLLPIPLDQKAGIIKAFVARYGTVGTSIPSGEPLMPMPYKDVSTANVTLMNQLREAIESGMNSNYPGLLKAKKPDGSKP